MAVVLCIAIPIGLLRWQSRVAYRQIAQVVGAFALDEESAPDLTAIKMMAVYGSLPEETRELALSRITHSLGQPWGGNVIGWAGDAAINDIALLADGDEAIAVDGGGGLSVWNIAEAKVRLRRVVSDAPLTQVSTSRDGSVVAAAGYDGRLHVVHTVDWNVCTGTLSDLVVDEVAVNASGSGASVSTESGELRHIACGSRGEVEVTRVADFEDVLALAPVAADGVDALIRDGRFVKLVDAFTGKVLYQKRFPRFEFETGAVGPDGSWALTGRDRQIWHAVSGMSARPTGIAVPDVVTAMAVTEGGDVVYASEQRGVRVFVSAEDIDQGPVCMGTGKVTDIRAIGHVVFCGPPWISADLRSLRAADPSIVEEAAISTSSEVQRSSGPLRHVELDATSEGVLWSTVDGRGRLDLTAGGMPAGTKGTVLAISPQGDALAIGTDSSLVVELDLGQDPQDGRWTLREVERLRTRSGRVVKAIGYHEGSGSIVAQTEDRRWHRLPSCAGCTSDESVLWAKVRMKRRNMYADELLEILPTEVVDGLDIRPFPQMPKD